MFQLCVLTFALVAAEPAPLFLEQERAAQRETWQADYAKATDLAMKEKKDLLIYFRDKGELDDVFENEDVQRKLKNFVCLRVPLDHEFEGKKLLSYAVLEDMQGKPGLAIVSYHDKKLPTYAAPVSIHPLTPSRYRWVPSYGVEQLKIILDLPAFATLGQRSMIYAIRVHPEVPQSVFSTCHPAFLEHAQAHSKLQASMQRQHHANLITVMSTLRAKVEGGFGGAQEIVAESWGRFVGGENVLEAAFGCIDAWRHSSAHWGAVARRHSYFGYDIAQSASGTWYATGIFGQ
ncbi:MAG: thioredoxin family protein [Gemmataceae bacterium]|nr:thioredoxin family protein [Gemmataceae bacterium]MCI0739226.1 thioredoxin family protein [Gemmataceae bacterium]